MIHTNRLGAAILGDHLEVDKGTWTLTTKQGTPVVNGGGYGNVGPGGAVAPAGSAWVYISGHVSLYRSEVTFTPDGYALKENRVLTLSEATYMGSVDCFVAAILVGN